MKLNNIKIDSSKYFLKNYQVALHIETPADGVTCYTNKGQFVDYHWH